MSPVPIAADDPKDQEKRLDRRSKLGYGLSLAQKNVIFAIGWKSMLMPLATIPGPMQAAIPARNTPPPSRPPARNTTDHNVGLLQRTHALIEDRVAAAQYGTAYDYFMLEREARGIRRAYFGGLIAGAWKRVREGFATPSVAAGAVGVDRTGSATDCVATAAVPSGSGSDVC